MPTPPTVPTDNTQLPPPATSEKPYVSDETHPTVIAKAKKAAESNLKQKNRKKNEFRIDLPILLDFESATTYKLNGFTPDADSDTWVLIEMEIHMSGKNTEGSETRLTFQKALLW